MILKITLIIINRSAKAFVGGLDFQLREKVDVTASQWKVLAVLVNQDGLTQKEIADRLDLDGATLIPIIDKMEKDKLVVRKIDPTDDVIIGFTVLKWLIFNGIK